MPNNNMKLIMLIGTIILLSIVVSGCLYPNSMGDVPSKYEKSTTRQQITPDQQQETALTQEPSSVTSVQDAAVPPVVDVKVNNSDRPINIQIDGTVLLQWSTTGNPVQCFAGGDWAGNRNPQGGVEQTPPLFGPRTFTYTLTCSNSGGSSSDSVVVNVGGPQQQSSEPTTNQSIASSTPLEVHDIVKCPGKQKAVSLLIDGRLTNSIRSNLDIFENDLCNDGYTVFEKSGSFSSPVEVRGYLTNLYRQNSVLEGAILIGNMPHAYQWVTLHSTNPAYPDTSEKTISFQYYSDLDGVFSTSPGFSIEGQDTTYVFNTHQGEINSEIWIRVLPMYRGEATATIEALKDYFVKNHNYRTRASILPHKVLEVDELLTANNRAQHEEILGGLINGSYSWTPWSNSTNYYPYFNSVTGLSVDAGYSALANGAADIALLHSHGTAYAHGRLDAGWIETNSIKTFFFWSDSCATGNLDVTRNFLSEVIYNKKSKVVVARGTTNDSGGMGNNRNGFFGHNIATAMQNGMNFGKALLYHTNVPFVWPWSESREYHIATSVVLGDPTLKLQPY